MNDNDKALLDLGLALREAGYRFITATPESHRRINARPGNEEAASLRDVFGWSRPFRESVLPQSMLALLEQAGALESHGMLLRSKVRFSSLADVLYVHSGYPTVNTDAVFFGPDTYRFAALIERTLAGFAQQQVRCAVDIGCGTGAGGIMLARCLKTSGMRLVLADINEQALRYARINAALAGIENVDCLKSDILNAVAGSIDLIVSNPPYLMDPGARQYRDGGGQLGIDLSVRIVRESLARLAPGGRLILYTGTPIISGEDAFWQAVQPLLAASEAYHEYAEIDPDVFGEELESPGYAAADRLAAVSLVVRT